MFVHPSLNMYFTSPKINMLRLKILISKKEISYWRRAHFQVKQTWNLLDWRFQTVRLACWKWRLSNQTIRCLTFGDKRKILETFWSLYVYVKLFLGIHNVFSPSKKRKQQTEHHSTTLPFHHSPPQVRVNHHRCTIHALVHPGLCEDLATPTLAGRGYPATLEMAQPFCRKSAQMKLLPNKGEVLSSSKFIRIFRGKLACYLL